MNTSWDKINQIRALQQKALYYIQNITSKKKEKTNFLSGIDKDEYTSETHQDTFLIYIISIQVLYDVESNFVDKASRKLQERCEPP